MGILGLWLIWWRKAGKRQAMKEPNFASDDLFSLRLKQYEPMSRLSPRPLPYPPPPEICKRTTAVPEPPTLAMSSLFIFVLWCSQRVRRSKIHFRVQYVMLLVLWSL